MWTGALFLVYFFTHGSATNQNQVLKDFPPQILRRHIQEARHLPVCVVFRNNSEQTARVNRSAWKLWKDGLKDRQVYAYWQLGSLPIDQTSLVGIEGNLHSWPTLRCYLSPRKFQDYCGRGFKKGLASWLLKQVYSYENSLPEASLLAVQNSSRSHRYTIVGFASRRNHYSVEEILSEIHEKWASIYPVFFVHPYNHDVRELSSLCQTQGGASLVILGKGGPSQIGKPVYILHGQAEMTKHSVDVFLASRDVTNIHIDENNFAILLEESRHYVPTLVCLYAWWTPHVLSYLNAFKRSVEEIESLNLKFRFALLDVNTNTQHVIAQHIGPNITSDLPAVILFSTKWQQKTVVGINRDVFLGHLPTPGEIIAFAKSSGIPLVAATGGKIVYQPWGSTSPNEASLVTEGPFGRECTQFSHNQTESNPRVINLKAKAIKRNDPIKKPIKPKVYKNPIESLLPTVGGVAMVTDELWQDVIERSHAPSHPLYRGAEWRGEVTQVTMVIFIIDDCASCRRHMKLFSQLSEGIRAVEGGNVYLMNCTSDPVQCGRHNISGFPTLAAFRGIGWLHGEQCLSQAASKGRPYLQFNYHGALLLSHVVSWFAQTAAPAVENRKFAEADSDEMSADVWLVALMIPRRSDYLHRARLSYRNLYHYKCFRLACERLYGQAACIIRYSPNVPASEFEDVGDTDDMFITQVTLERRDGLSTQVMRLGEPLLETLEEESQNTIHSLHGSHRYDVRKNQRCEDDSAGCTEYVVAFTRDHVRLSVSQVTMTTFHSPDSVLTGHTLPILLAFAHHENLTQEAKFYKTLSTAGRLLYQDVVTVSVDVDQFMSWANRFVPRGYADQILKGAEPWLYHYPRFCMIYWNDHHHAAFYPDTKVAPLLRFKHKDIVAFARAVLANPEKMFVETEHF